MAGRTNAMSDAIDTRNRMVRDKAGVDLENPMQGGYRMQAVKRYLDLNPSETPDLDFAGPTVTNAISGYQMDAYKAALDGVRQANPNLPGLDQPIEQAAQGLANTAVGDLGRAQAANGGFWPSLPVTLAGGFVGSFRDPVNLAAMAVPIGGELKAASTFGRIVEGALRTGAVNAGITTIGEPAVQQWRAERGQETGLLPAAEDVGTAFLFGLPFGAAHGVLARRGGAAPADAGAAIGGDLAAAGRLTEQLPATAAPELHAAVAAEAADRAVTLDMPSGIRAEDGAQAAREAIRFGEDPDRAPLPAMPADVPEGTTDVLARRILDGHMLAPEDYAGRVDQRARAIDPEAFDLATGADSAVAAARWRLDDLNREIAATLDSGDVAPHQVAALEQELQEAGRSRVSDAEAKVASIEAELASITGKRRSSPRAKTLRDTLPAARAALDGSVPGERETALQAEIARLRGSADVLKADAAPRFAAREQMLRLALNDAVMTRGRIGPRLRAARAQAEAEAAAMGFETGPAPTPADALGVFQGSAAARTSALASNNPNLRMLGRLASLAPEALDQVRSGVLRPELAQHVAAMVPDPADHAAVVQAVAEAHPRSEPEARAVITAELQAKAAPEAAQRLLGAEPGAEVPAEVPATAAPVETPAERGRQVQQLEEGMIEQQSPQLQARDRRRPTGPQSLVAFLRQAGGIRDDGGELRARDLHRQFPGLVNNKAGLSLDRAREMAAEAGYLGGDTEAAIGGTTVNDLLQAIDSHPVYSVHDQARVMERDAKATAREDNARHEERYRAARDEVDAAMDEFEFEKNPVLAHDAARLMVEQGLSVDDALHDAVMARVLPEPSVAELDHEIPFDEVPGEGEGIPEPGEPGTGRAQEADPGTVGEQSRGPGPDGRTERTEAGEQGLIPGVEPVSERDRLKARAERPMRGGDAAPPEGGLFDEGQTKQPDLFDGVPLANREDGTDMQLGSKDDLAGESDPSAAHANLVKDCKI